MEYLNALWTYMLTSAPYLLLGIVLSGALKPFLSIEKVKKALSQNTIAAVLKSALVGVPLPLCSCGVIPAAVTLRKSGAGNGPTSSFLIATPESGVDSIAVTYGLMDLPMTIIRPISAFLSAFTAGVLQVFFNRFEYVEEKELIKSCCAHKDVKIERKKSWMEIFFEMVTFSFKDLVDDIAFWLFIGITVGAAIEFFIPTDFFLNHSGIEAKFYIILIGIPLYICASASTPIAASMMLKGMSPGTALLFLLVGPATNISNILVLRKYIGNQGIVINIFSIIVVALLMSFLTDFLYQYFAWPKDFHMAHMHEHSSGTFQFICAIILSLLIFKGILVKELIPRIKNFKLNKNKKDCCH